MSKTKTPAVVEELPTLDLATLDNVKGGAGSGMDMSSMMPMMMMMMMNKKHSAGPPPVAAAPVTPQFTVNGVAQSASMGADGSWNYTNEQ
jgi:hypothetical protein